MNIKDIIFQIEDVSLKEVLEYIVEKSKQKTGKTFVVTVNPEIIILAHANPDYEKALKSTDLALVDGVGVVWAGKMFGKSFKRRVHGSDLLEKLSKEVSEKPITVGFLGGRENVAEETAERLVKKYPGLKVAFAVQEWPGAEVAGDARGPASSVAEVADETRGPVARFHPASARSRNTDIRAVGIPSTRTTPRCDILFVAFGSPKQELWIVQNLPKIDVRVAIGVGGAFDFISGRVRRAPLWVRNFGLEWLFRLLIQPWRIKRQLALPKFVILVLRERFF